MSHWTVAFLAKPLGGLEPQPGTSAGGKRARGPPLHAQGAPALLTRVALSPPLRPAHLLPKLLAREAERDQARGPRGAAAAAHSPGCGPGPSCLRATPRSQRAAPWPAGSPGSRLPHRPAGAQKRGHGALSCASGQGVSERGEPRAREPLCPNILLQLGSAHGIVSNDLCHLWVTRVLIKNPNCLESC